MEKSFYHTGEFARKTSVTIRTLRFYDKVGLLSPGKRSPSGYRLYTDEDVPRLQQILALKQLGFSLKEIKDCLKHGSMNLAQALSVQKAMLQEKVERLNTVIRAIEQAEAVINNGSYEWEPIIHIIEVIQMEQKNEWVKKYFNEEQLKKLEEISQASYSQEDRAKIAEWGKDWSEEDQRRVSQQWEELYAEARRLYAAKSDPSGPEAQALAKNWMDLVAQFTRNDPGVTAGLKKFWKNMGELAPEQAPIPPALLPEENEFVQKALEIYERRA